jgi:hypothetical protein
MHILTKCTVQEEKYWDVFSRDCLGLHVSPPLLYSPSIICFSLLCNAVSLPEHFVFLLICAIVYVFSIGVTFGIRGCAH